MYRDAFLVDLLAKRKQANMLRGLQHPLPNSIDFCSNDYLGIIHHHLLPPPSTTLASGSGGSRLLAGNHIYQEKLEAEIAVFHEAEAALLFNSGYDANIGLIPSVARRGDIIFYDALVHASLRDGIQLSLAASFAFKHNNIEHLQQKMQSVLQKPHQQIFIITESVFSMDGDCAPINELVTICQQTGAHLIVDEAHAIGLLGKRGEGLVQQLGVRNEVFAVVHTYGKAPGCHGAAITGSQLLKEVLINYARSFIYSTALSEHCIHYIQESYNIFPQLQTERAHLQMLINYFQRQLLCYQIIPSNTPIQAVIIPGNAQVKQVAGYLQMHQIDARPILSPTVPAGTERLRIVLHAYNTIEQIDTLIQLLNNFAATNPPILNH